jgi:hypothetical protein
MNEHIEVQGKGFPRCSMLVSPGPKGRASLLRRVACPVKPQKADEFLVRLGLAKRRLIYIMLYLFI